MLPILTLHLLDVKIPANTRLMTAFFNGMRDTAEANKALFDQEDIPADIFHNDKVAYSGIQFTLYRGGASLTAVGHKEVRALELWYGLYKIETGDAGQNTLRIYEQYFPAITARSIQYHTANMLLKREIADEIEVLKSRFAVHARLEKYMYGNIKAFLVRVAGMELTGQDFISVKVQYCKDLGPKSTYHGGKLTAYEIKFTANVYLPQTLRLGQAVSLGYGNICHI